MLRKLLIPLLGLVILVTGCDFRDLTDMGNVRYVRIYVDEDIMNVTGGFYNDNFQHPAYRRPDIMRVALFDPKTGEMVSERYLRSQGDDSRGHFYYGYILADAGRYHMIAYNFGTESTVLSGEYDYQTLLAYTNEISAAMKSRLKSRSAKAPDDTKADESICYDADHLFVARAENIELRYHSGVDTLRNTTGEGWFRASSVVKSYYLQIGVTGAQYLSSASVRLTGMGREVRLSDGNYTDGGEVTLFFDMMNGKYNQYGTDYDCIYGTFGTFGRLPDADNELTVSFEMVTTYGTRLEETIPVKTTFLTEDAIERQWLILDHVIDIPAPPTPTDPGGGMRPTVTEWGDVTSNIDI